MLPACRFVPRAWLSLLLLSDELRLLPMLTLTPKAAPLGSVLAAGAPPAGSRLVTLLPVASL